MRYRFGELELDTESHQLLRAGEPIQLWPKVFELLRYFVEQRGRLITKQELLDHVWPDTHVADGSVLWTISHVRRALGQRGGQKLPLETVHKRGYRFNADVVEVTSEAVVAPPLKLQPQPARRPFVGREGVMSELQARLRDAGELGRGELCVLVGPAGIGKTRCMDELGAIAKAAFDVWQVRCVEDSWAPVFLPWTLVLSEAARTHAALADRANALLTRLRDERTTERGATAQEGSFWWHDGVAQLLLDAAAQRPIAILLDDLQWADAASLELLAFLAPELRHKPIVIVATLRADGTPAQTRALKRLWRHAYRIDLALLSEADVARYVCMVLATDKLRSDVLEALHRATAGNPLFLEHSLRELLRRPEPPAALTPDAIAPASIARDTLRSALERLDAATRELLGVASVLGERVELSDLQALAAREPEDLLALIEPAVREGIAVADGPSTLRFCHTLMRTVVYDDLPLQQRVALHRRAAEALEHSDDARSGEIAHHYYRSISLGETERIAAAAVHAARAAARLHAFVDASRYSAWAIEAQTLAVGVPPRKRAELLLFHAELQAGAGSDAAARETIASVVELARAHGLYDLLTRAARVPRPYTFMAGVEDPYSRAILEEALAHAPPGANDVRVSALSQLAWLPPYALDTAQSKAMSGEALEMARQLGDESLLLRALSARLHALSGPDDCDALLAVVDELLSLTRMSGAWVAASAFSARYGAQLYRGDLLGAAATRAELGRVADAQKWPLVIWVHDRFVVQAHIQQGDFAAASTALEALERHAERWRVSFAAEMHPVLHGLIALETRGVHALQGSADLSVLRSGLSFAPVSLRPTIARLLLELGDAELAKTTFEQLSATDFAGVPRDIGYLGALASLAVLAIRFDDEPRARRLYQLLAPYPHHNTMSLLLLHEGAASHFLGMLAAYLELHGEAERHFEDALAMNERTGQRPQLERTRRERDRWLSGRRLNA